MTFSSQSMNYLINLIRHYPDITILLISFITGTSTAIITKLWLLLHDMRSSPTLANESGTGYHAGTPPIISRFEINQLCQDQVDLFRNYPLYPAIRVVSSEANLFVSADRDNIELMIFSYLFSRLTTSTKTLKNLTIHTHTKIAHENMSVLELFLECVPETDQVLLPSSNHILTYRLIKSFAALLGGEVRITVDSRSERILIRIPDAEVRDTFIKAFHQN